MSDWWSMSPEERASEIGKSMNQGKPVLKNLWNKIKDVVEGLIADPKKPALSTIDDRSTEEVINDATEYLREKKGDIENVSDAEIQDAVQSVISEGSGDKTGKPQSFVGDKDAEEPSVANTFFSNEEQGHKKPDSDNGLNASMLGLDEGEKEQPELRKIGKKEAEEIGGIAGEKAKEQGLYLGGKHNTSIFDKEGNKWTWNSKEKKWEPAGSASTFMGAS